ncbi:MAG: DUF1778 domain-containing protein [Proteobacteria bacterium]|nr:DUF1778 domain-containing protein [Pseudomonadota bacterium]
MPRATEARRDRMHVRLDAATKRKLERAAAYEQKSVTDFVLANALAAAERVIEGREKIPLSDADWQVFYDALVAPPEALRKAVRRYRKRTGA